MEPEYSEPKRLSMSTRKEYNTIGIIGLGFLVLYWGFGYTLFCGLAIFILGLGFLVPSARKIIIRLWFKLSEILGFINSRILLTLIFFLILTPIALLSRLFSKDKLQLRKKTDETASYFHKRIHTYEAKDFENPW